VPHPLGILSQVMIPVVFLTIIYRPVKPVIVLPLVGPSVRAVPAVQVRPLSPVQVRKTELLLLGGMFSNDSDPCAFTENTIKRKSKSWGILFSFGLGV
jgi:hypothetical protein